MPPPSDTESMASCARSPEPPPKTPLPSRQEQARTSNNACFRFKQEGHWRKDSPFPSPIAASPKPPAGAGGSRDYPELLCLCGGPCIVPTCRTGKNPHRDFYRCPKVQKEDQCHFFKWCDEVGPDQLPGIKSPVKAGQQHGTNSPVKPNQKYGLAANSQNLVCKCGAGPCIILMVEEGEYFGCNYFACPIMKGQGACDQFQWCNSAASPCGGNEPINSLVPEEQKDPQAHEAKAADVIISGGTVVPTSRTQPPRSMREERETNYVDPLIRRINFEEDSPSKPVKGLKSISSRRVNDQENKTTVQVKWYESPANVNEAEKTFGINDPKNYGDEGLPNYSLVPEELDEYELCAVLEAIESKSSYNKAEDPKTYAAGAIKDSNILEESMVPTSPPLPLPLQADHASHAGLLSSPMKWKDVEEGSPSRPRKCYRCGREGHWIKDFTNLPLLQVRPVCPLEEQLPFVDDSLDDWILV